MSDQWKDHGSNGSIGNLLPGPTVHTVENVDTGEFREVLVGSHETTGEAIANGDFIEK